MTLAFCGDIYHPIVVSSMPACLLMALQATRAGETDNTFGQIITLARCQRLKHYCGVLDKLAGSSKISADSTISFSKFCAHDTEMKHCSPTCDHPDS